MRMLICNPQREDWISPLPFKPQACEPAYSVLLFEKQLHYKQGILTEFSRNIIQCQRSDDFNMVNPLQIQLNPSYEQCIFHSFIIHRKDTSIDMLKDLDFKEIQREHELEQKIYTGLKTYIAHIEGLFKGDTIEYSFSKVNNNPIYQNNFSYTIPLQYPVPINTVYVRILFEHENKSLRSRVVFDNCEEMLSSIISNEPYSYTKEKIPAIIFEDGMTASAAFPSFIELSTYETWDEFGKDLLTSFNQSFENQFDAKAFIEKFEKAENEEKTIETIINYIKTNIHYQSVCIDEHSYLPHSPDIVTKKNFGDCKDKSLLLKVLLQSIGVPCSVILVHTFNGSATPKKLIALSSFNHAIVKMTWKNEVYFIDSTDEYSPFFFETPIERDYKYYYDTSDYQIHKMEHLKNCSYSRSVRETLSIEFDHANLTVNDIYQNLEFPQIYSAYLNLPHEKLKQNYLDFFKQRYPLIEFSDYDSFQVVAHPEKAKITIFARFSIDEIWERSTNKGKPAYVALYPFLLDRYITAPETSLRKTPCIWPHPVKFDYSLEVFYSFLKMQKSREIIENDFFVAEIDLEYTNKLLYTMLYKSKGEAIPASEFKSLTNEISKLKHCIGRSIVRTKSFFNQNKNTAFTGIIAFLIISFLVRLLLTMLGH